MNNVIDYLTPGQVMTMVGLRHPETRKRYGSWEIMEHTGHQIRVRPAQGTPSVANHTVFVDVAALTHDTGNQINVNLYQPARRRT